MKIIALIISIFFFHCSSFTEPVKVLKCEVPEIQNDKITKLIKAIAFTESSYRMDVVGDSGTAYGLLQIHQCILDEVKRISGKEYTLQDCLNPYIAIDVFLTIQKKYNPELDFEKGARLWNGWDLYCKKESTQKYWNKVVLALNN
jgi:hypothetical protein